MLILRPYQNEIIEAALKEIKESNAHLIVLPTGAGKTIILAHLLKSMGKNALIVAHTREIIEQIQNTLSSMLGVHENLVTTIQSLSLKQKKERILAKEFDLLVIDECHRSLSPSYLSLIEHFKAKNKKILGLTATPFRSDLKKLSDIFSSSFSKYTILDLIQAGYLCDFEGYRIKTFCSLKNIRLVRGDFTQKRLEAVVNVKNRNELIVNEYLKICPNDKAVAFCVSINHAYELKKEFISKGIRCEAIEGKMDSFKRKSILADFKEGKIQVLTNCNILTEGFNEPSIKCLLMARPTCSKVLYMQMVGRGARIYEGKEKCTVIEFTDNDYDVCDLSDLIEKKIDGEKVTGGEKLSEFYTRIKKELPFGEETFKEKVSIVSKTIYEKSATSWQREQLKKMKVKFVEPLTEFVANYLIEKNYEQYSKN